MEQHPQHGERPDPWAPWRERIESLAASCADYLGRITRSLARGTDQHYVTDKAHQLRTTAGLLVDACHEATADAGRCQADIERVDTDGEARVEECARPRGHSGPHSARRPATPLERAAEAAHELAQRALKVSDYLAWLTRPGGYDPEDLSDLEGGLDRVRLGLSEASRAVRALRNGERGGDR